MSIYFNLQYIDTKAFKLTYFNKVGVLLSVVRRKHPDWRIHVVNDPYLFPETFKPYPIR